jgi:hypothetical protein
MRRASFLPNATFLPLAGASVAAGGWFFYLGVERTSLQLRDRWSPRRTKAGANDNPNVSVLVAEP